MYVVSISVDGIVLNFAFKAYKAADDLFNKASSPQNGRILIEDDYGSKGSIDVANVAVNFTDMEKDFDRQGQAQILQHKAQLKTQNMANNDIGLQLLTKQASPQIIKQ